MDQCTHEVRAQYWKGIMQACQQRPQGQSTRQWLKDNGILEQSYYKWQHKFRKEIYGLMNPSDQPMPAAKDTDVSFAEIPVRSAEENIFSDAPWQAFRSLQRITLDGDRIFTPLQTI